VPRWLRRCLYALAALLGLAVLVVGAWALDANAHEGKVLRGVTLAGREISGLDRPALTRVVSQVADAVPAESVEVRAPGGGFSVPAADLGVDVDEAATIRSALDLGRTGGLQHRFGAWLRSFRGERRAPVHVRVDERRVFATVDAKDPGPRTPPTEPSITYADGKLQAVEGKPGQGIDAHDLIEELPGASTSGRTIVVEVDRGDVEPRFSKEEAERLAGEVQAQVSTPMPVTAGDAKATVPVATLRSWITSEVRDDALRPKIKPEASLSDLAKLLKDAGDPAVETRFTVDGGGVQIIPGQAGTACCADEAAAIVETAMFDDDQGPPPPLPLAPRPPKLTAEKAIALGVKEPSGVFTTKHKCCEPRVQNIHRIADLLRGQLILPGDTFSVNDTIGKRTIEKGFVTAPVIANGEHDEDVGGGISQMATTLFNAAFFQGLDFGEYQSHSLYISRYPYGREATMGFPHPDLQIKNTSKYGVLIWPTYTDTSLTVTLYSTRFADVQQTGQSEAPSGNCKRVTTERTRTYLDDGHKVVDKVFARYRPAEGVNC
jgi:vancomycin resistance protein YoaR